MCLPLQYMFDFSPNTVFDSLQRNAKCVPYKQYQFYFILLHKFFSTLCLTVAGLSVAAILKVVRRKKRLLAMEQDCCSQATHPASYIKEIKHVFCRVIAE